MTSPAQDHRLVEAAWNHVAGRYLSYWSPRFEPFLRAAVDAFRPSAEGPILVAGCGPGDELLMLARRDPERSIMATDLSPGMVAIARRRVREAGFTNVLLAEDDAAQAAGRVRQAGGVFSSFVLQLLPNPMAALADWSRAIRKDGAIAALYWTRSEDTGSFALIQEHVRRTAGDDRPDWEAQALENLPRLGLRLEEDRRVSFEMEHGSPEELWRALEESGPLQVTLRKLGQEALERLEAEWLRDHGLERRGSRWVHRPTARLWLLTRRCP